MNRTLRLAAIAAFAALFVAVGAGAATVSAGEYRGGYGKGHFGGYGNYGGYKRHHGYKSYGQKRYGYKSYGHKGYGYKSYGYYAPLRYLFGHLAYPYQGFDYRPTVRRHYRQQYAYGYGRGCHPVSKIGYDAYGRKARIGGTMCYDAYGRAYVVAGSRHIIHYF